MIVDGHWYRRNTDAKAVRAMYFDGKNQQDIWDRFGVGNIYGLTEKNPTWLILNTYDGGKANCHAGMWVVEDAKPGTFYALSTVRFARNFTAILDVEAVLRQEFNEGIVKYMEEKLFEVAEDEKKTVFSPSGHYVRKPDTALIRAIRFTGDNLDEVSRFFGVPDNIYETADSNALGQIYVKTVQGERVRVSAGEWVLPDTEPDTFYPVKDEVFRERFEAWEDKDVVLTPIKPMIPTHIISLSVTVAGEQQWREVFESFSDYVQDRGNAYPSAHVSSVLVEEDETRPVFESDDVAAFNQAVRDGVKEIKDVVQSALREVQGGAPDDVLEDVHDDEVLEVLNEALQFPSDSDNVLQALKNVGYEVWKSAGLGATPVQTVVDESLRYDENTLGKVHTAIQHAIHNVSEQQRHDIINQIMNAGIVFRERAEQEDEPETPKVEVQDRELIIRIYNKLLLAGLEPGPAQKFLQELQGEDVYFVKGGQ